MKKTRILLCSLLLTSLGALAQHEGEIYVIDSVEATSALMENLSPDQIGLISIVKGQKAVEKYGSRAANAVIYVETKPFARKRVRRLLSAAAPAYDSLLRRYGSDSSFQYIVNDYPVTPTDETRLMTLDKKTFVSLEIVSPRVLEERYHIKNRQAGVLIVSTEK
ncbi:hypothetical protein HF324_02510 [Chitinophaga oryzae]|uniref:TonB-dependent receptor plug domain-containing protein n=1 Tax=Chitinophaga oryzae TaxID=2725414 RepID=A0AAE6ZDK4_9BACT|nr:hypothetical protein [Chitinophaga oryzae]QJB30275.1 hypothetical protein HF329_02750 [Chitinophaga oryzae]QJB36784.1 hypothetical protein HF324_02510 [Chitinophaga oryzae]